jgi:DNA-binding NarL/FixJ family response regulator
MDTDKLVAAAQAVANGLVVVEPKLTVSLLPATESDDFIPDEQLTPREMEVLQRLAEGLTNKAIAQELGISEHTVKFHVNAIMGKLQAQSRTEAVVRATRLGLILL